MRPADLALPLLTALLVLDAAGARAAAAAPADLKHLHVLLVFDTKSDLEDGLKVDLKNLQALFGKNIPAKMYTEKVLVGNDVSPRAILDHYKGLTTVGKDDALLFYYGGHGATQQNGKHVLTMEKGRLVRDDLLQAMQQRTPGLVVVLTDCCSNRPELKRTPVIEEKGVEDLQVPYPVFRSLFFRSRGVVDVTAATLDSAYGDDHKGGLFTRSFRETMESNRAKTLTWKEAFGQVKTRTTSLFDEFMKDPSVRGDPQMKNARRQVPRALALAEPAKASGNPTAEFLVVTLENRTEKEIVYEYRWSADSAWREAKLVPKASTVYFRTAAEGVVLQTRLKGKSAESKLAPSRWSGPGEPTVKDGKLYAFKPRP